MIINKVDVFWNYLATFLKIASSALLLPLILKFLPSEEVGVWAIFSSIAALIFLLDFGFNSSFTRNVTYVFSGAQIIEKEGINIKTTNRVNYGLLKSLINSMKWFYSRIAIILLLLLLVGGTFYLRSVLKGYSGNISSIYIAWTIFCVINTYNLYTLYYDALLEGRGLIRKAKKIIIIGNLIYLAFATALVLNGLGLLAIVSAQLLSVLIIRYLSFKAFYDEDIKNNLFNARVVPTQDILRNIFPNAVKYGVTSFGGFMIQRSSIFIGATFLPLYTIASFGITKQLLEILIAIANISIATYLPKIASLRINGNNEEIKIIYIKGIIITNIIFVVGALSLYFLAPFLFKLIGSNTQLVFGKVLLAMLFSTWIGLNAGISGAVISTKNVIPFMVPSLLSGLSTVLLLLFIFNYTNFGLLGMALAPGIIDLCYQGWKWPYEVIKDLKIGINDFKKYIIDTFNFLQR